MDNSANKFPKNIYTTLKNDTHYDCQGSCCTCRFLKDRSNYDIMQYEVLEQGKKINLPVLHHPKNVIQW
jgi:hypothetical protein